MNFKMAKGFITFAFFISLYFICCPAVVLVPVKSERLNQYFQDHKMARIKRGIKSY